jgi:hypothetical protein
MDEIETPTPGRQPAPATEPARSELDGDGNDVEGHAATIYRRRRGPYPLRASAVVLDSHQADDATRRSA